MDEDVLVTSLKLSLRLENPKCINAMMLHPLVPRVREHNMGRVRGVERLIRIGEVERMEGVRGVEEAIAEIR